MQRTAIQLAVLALWAGAVTPVSAQTQEVTLEKVKVTGSNIPQVADETATPTLILTRKDIERTGLGTVKEVLDSLVGTSQLLTGSNRTQSDITGGNAFGAGGSSVSLRYMGPQATLVLLNGRRLAPYALHDDPVLYTDVNALPLSAVERIEVLRNGGSAVYGSDAIAGVINIITKQNFNGVELRASHEQSTASSDFRTSSAGMTAGFGNLAEDGFNVLINAELYKRSSVMWGDVMAGLNQDHGRYSSGFGAPSTYSSPGNLFPYDESLPPQALAGCAPSRMSGPLCTYDRYSRLEAQPSSDRANLLVSATANFTPQVQGFGEVLLSSNTTYYTLYDPAYGVGDLFTWYDPSTGKARQFWSRGMPKEHPLNPYGTDDVDFRYRFTDANSYTRVQSDAYRAMGGLRGSSGRIDWETAAGVMGSTVVNDTRGAFSDSGFKALIGDYTLANDPDFFNRGYHIGGPNSAAVLDQLFPVFTHTGRMKQAFVDGKLNLPVGQIGNRPVDMAFGFDLRHESLDITPSANLLAGDIVGYGVAETHGKRTFGSVFTEANLPVTESLTAQAAVRLDKYPNFDVNLSPKLGLRFEASRSLMLRGTVEAGFRAPNLVESSNTSLYTYENGVSDPKRCPAAQRVANGLRDSVKNLPETDPAYIAAISRADIVQTQECSAGVAAVRAANTELKPEKALGSTLGLVFAPVQDVQLEVDAWRIERRDEIGNQAAQDVLNQEDILGTGRVTRVALDPTSDRSFTAAEIRDYGISAGALSGLTGRYQNNARTLAQGLDVAVHSRSRTSYGIVGVTLQATYLDTFQQFSSTNSDYGDNLAGRYGYPRWRAYVIGSLDNGPFSNALRLNYMSGTTLTGDYYDTSFTETDCAETYGLDGSACRVKQSVTVDWAFAWRGIKGLTLGLNVRNLFNTRPPFDARAFLGAGGGVIPSNLADAYRRTVRVSVAYSFL